MKSQAELKKIANKIVQLQKNFQKIEKEIDDYTDVRIQPYLIEIKNIVKNLSLDELAIVDELVMKSLEKN